METHHTYPINYHQLPFIFIIQLLCLLIYVNIIHDF